MKKLIWLLSLIIACTVVNAQEKNKNQTQSHQVKTVKEAIKMIKGKIVDVRNGNNTVITSKVDIYGTVVSLDGTLSFKDGHKDKLNEGDVILENGTVLKEASQTFTDPGK
jgi:hypothetical protein